MTDIAVIIPTYRRADMLARAIRSVLAQTYRDFEVRIYDNASDDRTMELVLEFARNDKRIKYHRHSSNLGWLENFRYGMKEVDSPFFTLLGDDDFLFPEFFERAMVTLKVTPSIGAFFGACAAANDSYEVLEIPVKAWKQGLLEPPIGMFEILANGHTNLPGLMFNSAVISQLGIFDTRVGIAVDVDYQLRVAARFPVAVCHDLCGVFVRHRGQTSDLEYTANLFWPSQYIIAQNIFELSGVATEDKRLATRILLRKTKTTVFFRGCKAAVAARSKEALETRDMLSNGLHAPAAAATLRLLTFACQYRTARIPLLRLAALARRCTQRIRQHGLTRNDLHRYSENVKHLVRRLQDPRVRLTQAAALSSDPQL